MPEKPFFVDYDKRGAAKCKKCKEKMEKGHLRIARLGNNPFSEDGGDMKHWYHIDCLIETFKRARATTKKLEDPFDDIDNWENITKEDQKLIMGKIKEYIKESENKTTPKKKATPKKTSPSTVNTPSSSKATVNPSSTPKKHNDSTVTDDQSTSISKPCKDNLFKEFRRLCASIAEESSYLKKTSVVATFFEKGNSGDGFEGDLGLWVRLLLPGVVKRVYNLQSRQLTKVFSQIFQVSQDDMLEDLEKGDIAETIRVFFESANSSLRPTKKSSLTLQQVDNFLQELEGQTTEESHAVLLTKVAKRCTGNDLKMFVRLIKGDLRINAGAKHILEAVHKDAYEAFQRTRSLDAVLEEVLQCQSSDKTSPTKGTLDMKARVMTPILPMLAQACRSVSQALSKCPNGMAAEVKYDGERLQLHKQGDTFKFFSRSLKPVMAHKVSHLEEYIPRAFPSAQQLILDAEVLLMDTKSGQPLPFGTLGKHKKEAFKDATVCLFVFDCLHYNGEDLMNKPFNHRRSTLKKFLVEIEHRVVLSEMREVNKAEELQTLITRVLKQGLEGLVLKDLKSVYEPGKRHWLKVKKDYLSEGALADTADLVVLGAWFGTGKKGGLMSVFLMGCFDPQAEKWCTVTKVHTGFDDAALARIQTELDMRKIAQNADALPSWIRCARTMAPDFIANDPKNSPVWEITGAEFTCNQVHTADGISIRFPRVTRERSDKDWAQATDLPHLKELYKTSKEHSDITGLASDDEEQTSRVEDEATDESPKKKRKNDDPKANFLGSESRSSEEKSKSESKRSSQSKSKHHAKRSAEDDKDKSPSKRKRVDEKNINDTFKAPVKRPLPSIFDNVRLYIPEETADRATLARYFVAYGGELLEDYDKGATHHMSGPAKNVSNAVSIEWLWDSIKQSKLQSTRSYRND